MKIANYRRRLVLLAAGTLALSCLRLPAQSTNSSAYPIDLPAALQLAGAQNLDVQIARAHVKEAEAERTSALERFFPWITPGISYHRRDGVAQGVPSGIISDAHFQSYNPGATLSAQVDLGDALYQSLATKQIVKAADQALETQRQDVILTAAQGYFELTRTKALVAVIGDTLKTSEEYLQQLHAAVDSGIAFKGDELRVQTQTKNHQIALRQAVEQQRVAVVNLARTLHLDARVELVPQDTGLTRLTLIEPGTSIDDLVEQALERRPELRQRQALISAARESKKAALYGPLIPTLGAQVFAGGLGGGPDGGRSALGAEGDYLVGMSWRIGPGGLFDSGRVRASSAQLSAAELEQTKLKDEITSQVVAGLTRLRSLGDQIVLAEGNLATASETLRLTRERKQFGVGVVLEEIQAEQELEGARSQYVSALAEFNKTQYGLSRAVGSLPGITASSVRSIR
jgi:outer membrane protein TolC